jgi:RNA polymerase sigma factor (sigma-70 family)
MTITNPNLDLKALREGDEQAWTLAFQELWRFAFHAALCPQAGLKPDEAEDVAIDALTKLVPLVSEISTVEGLKAMLVTIAHRQAISLARKKSALKRPEIGLSLDELPPAEGERLSSSAGAGQQLSTAELAELVELLHEALSAVDPITRQLLAGHHVEGLRIRELSGRFGLPAGTVTVKMARGLQQIRRAMEKCPGRLKQLREFLR